MIDLVCWALAVFWATYALRRAWAVRGVTRLPPPDPATPVKGRSVSVIVTARDEERRLEATVRRLMAQRGIRLEIVVVDDRSEDGTPRILAELADTFPKIRRVRVDALPEGWLGKTHACHVGAQVATGEWLLFADADVWMAPDLVAHAVAVALDADVEHLCLLPREHRPNFVSKALHVFAAVLAAPVVVRMNRGARGAFAGVGAFNLVRAEAYRAVGGHASLKLAVVDDLELGLALYRAGYHSRVFEAFDDLSVEWAPTARGWIRALEKNFFALLGFSVPLAMAATLVLPLLWAATVAAPFTGRTAGLAAGLAWLASGVPGLAIARRAGYRWTVAAFSPFTLPIVVAALVHSTVRTLAAGGVRWRGTFYPLARLAPGGVWRVAPPGLREILFAPRPKRPTDG